MQVGVGVVVWLDELEEELDDEDGVGQGGSGVVVGELDELDEVPGLDEDELELEFVPGNVFDGGVTEPGGVDGTGGGGTDAGGGAAPAFGAPMGTLLSGVGSTPVRYASAQISTVFT